MGRAENSKATTVGSPFSFGDAGLAAPGNPGAASLKRAGDQGVAPVLRRYRDGIATVLLHRISLVHPFYIPCTSLIHDWRLRKLDRASTKPGDAFEGIGLAAIQSALRLLLLAWRRFGMQAGAGDAGENAASEVLERGGQRGRVPGEEFRAPFGQFAAGVMGLPVLEELLGFGGAVG